MKRHIVYWLLGSWGKIYKKNKKGKIWRKPHMVGKVLVMKRKKMDESGGEN
jgi:hypothetical protein